MSYVVGNQLIYSSRYEKLRVSTENTARQFHHATAQKITTTAFSAPNKIFIHRPRPASSCSTPAARLHNIAAKKIAPAEKLPTFINRTDQSSVVPNSHGVATTSTQIKTPPTRSRIFATFRGVDRSFLREPRASPLL